jgi:Spy/CpxP family protein refolding chaperone
MTDPGSGGSAMASLPAAARNPRLLAGLVIVLALVVGMVIGGVAARRFMPGHGGGGRRPPYGARGPWSRGGPTDQMRQRLASELGLSAAQAAQVDSIVTRSMAARQALDDSVRPRMRALLDSTRAQIERVLTPDQRQKFEALHTRDRSARTGGDSASPSRK